MRNQTIRCWGGTGENAVLLSRWREPLRAATTVALLLRSAEVPALRRLNAEDLCERQSHMQKETTQSEVRMLLNHKGDNGK